MSSETVFVKILDKEFQVACPAGERDALVQAAQNLDTRMREIRRGGTVIGLERIAIMAALNLSHDLLQAENAASAHQDDEALTRLSDKIDQALDKF